VPFLAKIENLSGQNSRFSRFRKLKHKQKRAEIHITLGKISVKGNSEEEL